MLSPGRGLSFRGLTRSKKKSRSFRKLSGCYSHKREWCPKVWLYFGAGAPRCTFGTPVCFWTQKVYPECSQNDPKGAKVTLKCSKSDPQGRKMDSYRSAKVVQVHEQISAARYQARRTARSAYNKLYIEIINRLIKHMIFVENTQRNYTGVDPKHTCVWLMNSGRIFCGKCRKSTQEPIGISRL